MLNMRDNILVLRGWSNTIGANSLSYQRCRLYFNQFLRHFEFNRVEDPSRDMFWAWDWAKLGRDVKISGLLRI